MSIKCFMNGLEVNYPCSPACALFGDCVTAFEGQKKANVRTNADRIRAMTDEELVNYLDCPHDIDPDLCIGRGTCYDCTLKWLQQPVDHFRDPTKMMGGADHEKE